ncbi:uncharacterized protein P884DRAFT_276565 [Thermothelomyces heterothallicus CBS 202.75]|uniref:uncharacterized protein n=1 Tax=Thermothelomyces heterothallicus CBS 202.75 TaxID=1149848 RepID=UPI0037423643
MSNRDIASYLPANDLLYGFDICDEETRQFLASFINSGRAPQTEINELRDLSLLRGAEEWDMLFECASNLRKRGEIPGQTIGEDAKSSLVPFLELLLNGPSGTGVSGLAFRYQGPTSRSAREKRETRTRRSRDPRQGSTSHFWGDDEGGASKVGQKQRHQAIHSFPIPTGVGNQVLDATGCSSAEKHHVASACVVVLEKQAVLSTASVAPARAGQKSPETITKEQENPSLLCSPNQPAKSHAEVTKTIGRAVKASGGLKSPFFGTTTPTRGGQPKSGPSPPSTAKNSRPPRGIVSSLPILPLTADRFGLIQEELADDPFRLLIAVTFLIRTTGRAAIPVFWQLMERFPTAEALAAADPAEVTALIRPLGLSAVRCAAIQNYARRWLERPPTRNVRYGVKNYPRPGDARHVRAGEEFGPEDDGADMLDSRQPADAAADARDRAVGCAWEIGHLTQGPYALDSWRIFCRDVLLGRSCHWTGKGCPPEFQPEWMRVLPRDKELRACLRWMWMREGWEWDPLTGEREPLREDLRLAVNEGRVGYDDGGNLVILQ